MKHLIRLILIIITIISLSLSVSASSIEKSFSYDDYGRSVPSPITYEVSQVIDGDSIGVESLKNPQDIFVSSNKNIYIADTGNNRVIILSPKFEIIKVISQLTNTLVQGFLEPSGLFVDKNGLIYVCDSGNGRAIKFDSNGLVITEYKKPDSKALPEDFVFKPFKIAVDSTDGVYIVAYGLYQGLVYYNNNGDFINFYGSNKVEATLQVIADNLWKKFFTKSQREATVRTIPTEYSNIFIDNKNFVYTSTLKTNSSLDEAKKLNALGNNVLRFNAYNTYYPKNNFGDIDMEWVKGQQVDNVFADIYVDNNGIMALLDRERCRIFEYSKDNDLILIYGTKGNKKGEFLKPSALDKLGENYIVVDADKGTITVLEPTEYTKQLKNVMKLYSDGLYEQTIVGFNDLLKQNNNLSLAYKGIGKAYLQKEEYKTAMYYLKKANDRQGYSDTLKEYRKIFVRQHLLFIVIGIIGTFVLSVIFIKKFKAWLLAGRDD